MKHIVLNQTPTQEWETECSTAEECVNEAQAQWNHLTRWEQKGRTVMACAVRDTYGKEDESGNIDSDILDILWDSASQKKTSQEASEETILRNLPKRISKNGHSLTLNITVEAQILGLEWGDTVMVTLQRPKGD